MHKRTVKYLLLIITVLLFITVYLIGQSIPKEEFQQIIIDAGIFAPIVFIFLTLLTSIIAPLSNLPIYLAGFYAFREDVVIYTLVANFISWIINFWISRIWGEKIVKKFVGENNMHKVDKLTKNYGLAILFLMRIFLGGMGDFISYGAGLTSIKFKPYLIISTLGAIPGTILWYYFASKIHDPLIFILLNALLLFLLGSIFTLIIKSSSSLSPIGIRRKMKP